MNELLSDLTWQEVKEAFEKGATVIVPIGSNEQHGPHMPINCDSYYVTQITSRVVKRLSDQMPIYRTPTVWTGYSPHHKSFPGTITLSLSTFLSMIYDICASLIHHNVRRLVLINGHGGNATLLRSVGSQIGDELNHSPMVLSYWDVIRDDWESFIEERPAGIGHSGETETSLRLFLAPDTIRQDALENAEFVAEDPSPHIAVAYQYEQFQDINSLGYTGHPKWGTAEKGERILHTIVERLSKLLLDDHREWIKGKGE